MKVVLSVVGFLVFVALLVAGAREMALKDQPPPQPKPPPAKLAQHGTADTDDADDDDNNNNNPDDGAPAARTPPPLPALTVYKDGKELALAGPRKKPLLLHLWASWCGPCRQELPLLLNYGRTGPAELLAVSVDDYWEPVVKYFNGNVPPEVAWDKKIMLEKTLGVDGIPATFLVDKNGIVRERFDGATDWNNPEVRKIIDDDVKEK